MAVAVSGALGLDYDDRWVVVDLDHVDEWASAAARERWSGGQPEPGQVEVLSAGLAHVGDSLAESEAAMAFLLVPEPAAGIVAAVAVRAFPAEGMSLDDVTGEVLAPPEAQLGEPDVSRVATPAGEALRVVQRYAEPVDPRTERVVEQVLYAWVLGGHDLVVTATTAFGDPGVAEQWRPAVDELARTFTVEA